MRRTIVLSVIAAAATIAADSAFAQAAGAGANATPRVSISAVVFDANGRSPATTSSSYGADFTHYAYAGKTICQIGGSEAAARRLALGEMYTAINAARGRVTSTMASGVGAPDQSVMPTDAGFGWRIDGKIVSASPNEVVVQIDWQRMWDRGETVNGPRGSTRLALHPGERVPLDSIAAVALPGGCTGVTLTLQAAFSPYATGVVGGRGGGGGVAVGGSGAAGGVSNVGTRGGGVGVAGGGAGGGRGGGGGGVAAGGIGTGTMGGVASGGGRGGGVGGGFGGGARGGVASGGVSSGSGGNIVVSSGFDPQTLHLVDAELWLVHKKPDGSEVAQQRTVRTVPGTGEFTFDTVPVPTPDGNYVVTVTGSVQAQRLPDGTEKLFVGIIRRIAVVGEAGYFSTGGSGRTVAMPKAGDVISFEMPDTGARAMGVLDVRANAVTPAAAGQVSERSLNPIPGHEFSVRVRVNR